MGYIRNEIIVVTGDDEDVRKCHSIAIYCFNKNELGKLVGSIVPHVMSGQSSFFIAPSGSKQGWDVSNNEKESRDEFIAFLRKESSINWALIRIGGDDDGCEIIDSDKMT